MESLQEKALFQLLDDNPYLLNKYMQTRVSLMQKQTWYHDFWIELKSMSIDASPCNMYLPTLIHEMLTMRLALWIKEHMLAFYPAMAVRHKFLDSVDKTGKHANNSRIHIHETTQFIAVTDFFEVGYYHDYIIVSNRETSTSTRYEWPLKGPSDSLRCTFMVHQKRFQEPYALAKALVDTLLKEEFIPYLLSKQTTSSQTNKPVIQANSANKI